jgi:hypothetical protein
MGLITVGSDRASWQLLHESCCPAGDTSKAEVVHLDHLTTITYSGRKDLTRHD